MTIARTFLTLTALTGMALVAACGPASRMSAVPAGAPAYEIAPPADAVAPATEYTIIPGDVLNVQVFQEPDISREEVTVDLAGNIQLPLVGELPASDRTPTGLANDIASRLGARFIRSPDVSVAVVEAAARHVSVEGEVKRPGVYEFERNYTLLSALARAESPTPIAKLDEVVIFRTIEGKRMAARFDLTDVRAGLAPDPAIKDGDVVVVGFSKTAKVWKDVLTTAPTIFNAFVYAAVR